MKVRNVKTMRMLASRHLASTAECVKTVSRATTPVSACQDSTVAIANLILVLIMKKKKKKFK